MTKSYFGLIFTHSTNKCTRMSLITAASTYIYKTVNVYVHDIVFIQSTEGVFGSLFIILQGGCLGKIKSHISFQKARRKLIGTKKNIKLSTQNPLFMLYIFLQLNKIRLTMLGTQCTGWEPVV
jgi:hypothetical protein